MEHFLRYLESLGEFWIVLDEDGNIRSSESKHEIQFIYTEWTGIFNFDLQVNTVYRIKSLLEKIK